MPWMVTSLCPNCGRLNNRYHYPENVRPDLPCLGIVCECECDYIVVIDVVHCIGCSECVWEERGFTIKEINLESV